MGIYIFRTQRVKDSYRFINADTVFLPFYGTLGKFTDCINHIATLNDFTCKSFVPLKQQ